MKKLIILPFMALVAIPAVFGQTVTKKASLKQLHPSFKNWGYSFKWDEKEAYIISLSGTYNISMNKVQVGDEKAPKKTRVEAPLYDEKKVRPNSCFNMGREVFMTATVEDKKNDKVTYMVYKLDYKNFSIASTPAVIDSYTEIKGQDIGYEYEVIDERSLLVKKSVRTKIDRDYTIKVCYMMYDQNMEKLWEREIEPPVQGKKYIIERWDFHDEDNLLVTCVEYPDGIRKAKKKGKPNYKYHLFYYTNKMQTVKDYELDLEGKFITDVSAGINDNKQIICAGFYSKSGFYDLTGCFYMKINTETKKVEKTSLKEFDNSFNLSLMSKRQKRKAKRKEAKGDDIDAPDFDLRKLYYDDEGNALLLAEDFYITTHCYTDSKGNSRCYDIYHYDDLIAVAINSSGDIVWNTKIDKKLSFRSAVSASFLTISEKGKWVFMYNENLKNLEKDAKEEAEGEEDNGTDRSAGRKHSAPVIVVLDENGKHTKEVLMMPEGKRSVTLTSVGKARQLENKGYVIEISDPDGEYYYLLDLKL